MGPGVWNLTIPSIMWNLTDNLYIDLSSNSINGSLSTKMGNLKVVGVVNLSGNRLSGDIPVTLGGLKHLQNLSLADNNLQGTLPNSFVDLISLVYLDLSRNNLSGAIPKKLEAISFLRYLNVSFNSLEGEIPEGGSFAYFSAQSFPGNNALCGDPQLQVPPCKTKSDQSFVGNNALYGDPQLQVPPCKTRSHGHRSTKAQHYVLSAVAASVLLLLAIMLVLIRCRKRKQKLPDYAELSPQKRLWRISYAELCRAIVSCCSNNHFKALVMEYMPNGSLEDLLYGSSCSLGIRQRLNLAIDIASGL